MISYIGDRMLSCVKYVFLPVKKFMCSKWRKLLQL